MREGLGIYKGWVLRKEYVLGGDPRLPGSEARPSYSAHHPSGYSVYNRDSLEELKANIDQYAARPQTITLRAKGKEAVLSTRAGMYTAEDLDPELIPVLVDLNNAGFETLASCAGHPRTQGRMTGVVSIKGASVDTGEVKKIFTMHGITKVQATHQGDITRFEFPAIGN